MKDQRISPLQLNGLMLQHLILSELMKISDLLAEKEPAASYDGEIQKRVQETMKKFVKAQPGNQAGAEKAQERKAG